MHKSIDDVAYTILNILFWTWLLSMFSFWLFSYLHRKYYETKQEMEQNRKYNWYGSHDEDNQEEEECQKETGNDIPVK